jgi:hypothetical protein
MRILLLLTTLWLFAQQDSTGALRVTIRVPGTLEPVAGAEISLVGSYRAPRIPPTTTDANGNATFSQVSPGEYIVTARREGYVGTLPTDIPGIIVPPASSTAVIIGSQQTIQEVNLFLNPGATVSGRIHDAKGVAIVNARVSATIPGYRDGKRTLLRGPAVQTGSGGEYRLVSLSAGEYFLTVDTTHLNGRAAYYPNVLDLERATSISIAPGEDVVGVDIEVPDVPKFRVSGTVLHAPRPVTSFVYLPQDPVKVDLVDGNPNGRI